MAELPDPRSEERRRLDDALAVALVEHRNHVLANDEAFAALPDPPQRSSSSYIIELQWGGFAAFGLGIQFYDGAAVQKGTFAGGAGGPGWGVGGDWGSGALNYSLEEMDGWECRFAGFFTPAFVDVQLWGLGGEYIGEIIIAGIGIGGATVGGQGTMKAAPAPEPL